MGNLEWAEASGKGKVFAFNIHHWPLHPGFKKYVSFSCRRRHTRFRNVTGVQTCALPIAWAYPESSSCCGRSLWYVTNAIASVFARYAVEAQDDWAREIARRSQILGTYDIFPDGHSFDLIDGGAFVSRNWFKNAQPKALKDTLRTIEWLPELAAPARENHLVRSSSVVKH